MTLDDLHSGSFESIARPIWENLIAASKAKNYILFSQNFSVAMSKEATREEIEKQWQEQPMLCNLSANPEYMGNLKTSTGIRLLWKQKIDISDDEFLGHLALVIENGEIKVDGALVM